MLPPSKATAPWPSRSPATDLAACKSRLDAAVESLLQRLDGQRLVKVNAASWFSGGIDSQDVLDASLDALRKHCIELIAAGKKEMLLSMRGARHAPQPKSKHLSSHVFRPLHADLALKLLMGVSTSSQIP